MNKIGNGCDKRRLNPVRMNHFRPIEISPDRPSYRRKKRRNLPFGSREVPHVIRDAIAVRQALPGWIDAVLETLDRNAIDRFFPGRPRMMRCDHPDLHAVTADQVLCKIRDKRGD
jgi:hypothetical protein